MALYESGAEEWYCQLQFGRIHPGSHSEIDPTYNNEDLYSTVEKKNLKCVRYIWTKIEDFSFSKKLETF